MVLKFTLVKYMKRNKSNHPGLAKQQGVGAMAKFLLAESVSEVGVWVLAVGAVTAEFLAEPISDLEVGVVEAFPADLEVEGVGDFLPLVGVPPRNVTKVTGLPAKMKAPEKI